MTIRLLSDKLDVMSHTSSIKIVQAGKFLKLFKNDTLFATPIFRINKNRKNLQFVIVFRLEDDNSFYVLNRSLLGYSDKLQRIKTFTPSGLYQGMMAVPLRAHQTIQILQVPSDVKDIKSYISYYEPSQVDAILSGKFLADSDVYNPFRDAHSAVFHAERNDVEVVPSDDYQGIQDFHPFLTDGDQVLALPCSYKDPIRGKTITIQLMGWYFLDQQLKISWKPHNSPRARWRSSILAIDKKSRRYFFQGNIYKEKGTDPVFLENLSFKASLSSDNSRAAQAEFTRLINEVKKQEQAALLKMR